MSLGDILNKVQPASRSLTTRQADVLRGIASSENTKEIAARIGKSPKTVEYHRAKLMQKTGTNDVAGLTRFAVEHNQIMSNNKPVVKPTKEVRGLAGIAEVAAEFCSQAQAGTVNPIHVAAFSQAADVYLKVAQLAIMSESKAKDITWLK
jgi:DNA-binding CsgD family transcriptional regulator